MKHLLIIISILLLSSPVIGQSEKPQTIIVPTGSLGDISEVRKKMLEKTLESKLDDYFDIVPKELFEEAQEQVFQEMDADECTEEQCIMMIREILQVENSFQMVLMEEEGDTQISLTWNDLDKKRVEEEYCEGCKTKQLRKMIEGLVEKLIGVKDVVKEEPQKKVEPVVVEKKVTIPKVEPKVVVIPKKIAKRKLDIPSLKKLLDTKKCPNCDLSKANLSGRDLSKANLKNANLSGANLYGANLSNANLKKANLSGANLKKVRMNQAKLNGANLSDTNLEGASLSMAIFIRAKLRNANLHRADLGMANLNGADLTDANLTEANLMFAKLNRAILIGANLTRAILDGAKMEGAIMEGVIKD